MLSAISGIILLFISFCSYGVTRDKIHPAFVFAFVWGVGLLIISVLPAMGFYEINSSALILFVTGGVVFSIVSISTQIIISSHIRIPKQTRPLVLDLKRVTIFIFFTNLIVLTVAWRNFMSLGANISQAAYMVRNLSVHGEQVFSPIVSNYMLLGLVVIPLLTISLIAKKLNALPYLIISLPWAAMIMLISGRSSLIQLLLVLFFIFYLMVRKVSVKIVLYMFILFLLIIVTGALATNKVNLSGDSSMYDVFHSFLDHLLAYAFQGPVLFSEYYDGKIFVSPNWSPFRSISHILSFFGGAPPPYQHLEFNSYGNQMEKVGNVYSVYFSLYPNYGFLGAVIILMCYSIASTYIYIRAKSGGMQYILIAGYLFSAMVLSLFSDLFLTPLWFFIKLVLIVWLVSFSMNMVNRLSWGVSLR